MRNLKTELPSLNSLCVFEVAARLNSFTKAADELFITQGAVSRQIRSLETSLGISLFNRVHRGLVLSPDGQKLYESVAYGLSHIAKTVNEIRVSKVSPHITVSTTVSFAYFWLIPRLAKFRTRYPGIEIRVVPSDKFTDVNVDSSDIAIRHGDGNWPELKVQKLFDEDIYPVCSPSLITKKAPIQAPQDLLQYELLHYKEDTDVKPFIDWKQWLKSFGVTESLKPRRHQFTHYPMVIQAALCGEGIALGWSYVTDDLIKRGQLVRPINLTLRTRDGYFLARPRHAQANMHVDLLSDWILSELNLRQ